MRKLLIVLLWLALGATCFAQRHGGGRGFSRGHGFSRGSARGHGGGFGWSGYRGVHRGWSGYHYRGGGWYGGYRGYYGYPRFSFGIEIGVGYGAWGYWPDYYCYPPYPYVYSYPYPYAYREVYYRSAPRTYVEVEARSIDPDPAYTASLEDGKWHRFGERQEAVAARTAEPAPVRTGWRRFGERAAR